MNLRHSRARRISLWLAVSVLLAGCTGAEPIFVPVYHTPGPTDNSPVAIPEAAPSPKALAGSGPRATAYDLGDFLIAQPGNPAGEMPARLRGLIALPDQPGPHPVALILHDAGSGCPSEDGAQSTWPCGEAEQPNWSGYAYLASALAARGYVALVPDVNAQYEAAFGGASGFDRLAALAEAHLARLAGAAASGESGFDLDLTGRIDIDRVVLAGHGQGADGAIAIAAPRGQDARGAAAGAGRAPARAILLIAPSGTPPSAAEAASDATDKPNPNGAAQLPDVPVAVILPECDGHSGELEGARYYETASLDDARTNLVAEVFLRGANANAFSTFLQTDDAEAIQGSRAGCEPEARLGPEAQRKFLAQYAADFFDAVLEMPGSEQAAEAAGLDAAFPEPAFLYREAALTSLAAPTDKRLRLIVPGSVDEVSKNLLGGAAQIAPPAEVTFCPGERSQKTLCPKGFHPPGGAPMPSTLRLAWDGAGGLYQLDLPEKYTDLREYAALSLRVAVDPADPRNRGAAPAPTSDGDAASPAAESPGTPTPAGGALPSLREAAAPARTEASTPATFFSVVLRDAAGGATPVALPIEIPALAFPAGDLQSGEKGLWSAFTPLSSIRIPLNAFEGVDLSQVIGLAFSFDGPERGAIRVADLEFVAR